MSSLNAVALVGVLVLLFSLQTTSTTMRVGQVAGETVVAQRHVTYLDRLATRSRQQQAAAAVGVVYHTDPRQAVERKQQASTFLANVSRLIALRPPSGRQEAIRRLLPPGVSAGDLDTFYTLSAADFRVVRQHSIVLLSQATTLRFSRGQAQTTALTLLSSLPPGVTLLQRTAVGEILTTFLAPTEVPDIPLTRARRQAVIARVQPVYATLFPGQVVIRRGDMVTSATVEQLTALGLESHGSDWHDVLGALLFASAIILILFWYLHAFQASIVTNLRLLLLIDACILLTVGAARLLTGGHVLLPFMLPVAATATFAAVLIAPEACIALSFALAILAGWVVANSFELTVFYFLTSAAGVLTIRQVYRLKQFIIAGMYITVLALATVLAFGLVDRTYDVAALQEYVLASAFNGFVSSTLALGAFVLLSGYFGVTTTLQLFELGQPNQLLLRRLTSKAPGTYNHSLVVSSMAEQAAEEIGANSLVAKVSALYHDVGKTANPHCFVENQLGIANIHDELRSDESARIIRGHVVQGLRLARQQRLPRPILDAIAQHHGTMTLAYFLHKAQQEADGMPIDTTLYTYPGPKPQTKETAILMLADGCESAVRASSDHSQEAIRQIVRTIFRERIDQHQLDESPLTLKDLESIQTVFCSVLNGLYHPRIEYPETGELAVERRPVLRSRGGSPPGARA